MHKLLHALKKYVVALKENLQLFFVESEFAVFWGDIIQSDHKQGFHKVIDAKYYKQ
jgi:hypothetical protein